MRDRSIFGGSNLPKFTQVFTIPLQTFENTCDACSEEFAHLNNVTKQPFKSDSVLLDFSLFFAKTHLVYIGQLTVPRG